MYAKTNFIVFSLMLIASFFHPFEDGKMFFLVVEFLVANLFCSLLKEEVFFSVPLFIIRITGFFRYIAIAYAMKLENMVPISLDVFLLMSYEMVVVYISVFIYDRMFCPNDVLVFPEDKMCTNLYPKRGWLSVVVFLAGLLYCILNPVLLKNMFVLSREGKISVDFSSGFFAIVSSLFLILSFSYIVEYIERFKLSSNVKFFLLFVPSIFFISNMSISADSTSRWSMLISMVIVYYTILQYHPEKKRLLKILGLFLLAVVLIFGTMMKFSHIDSKYNKYTSTSDVVSTMFSFRDLNSYFSGPQNVEVGYQVSRYVENSDLSKMALLISDVFHNFPILNKYVADEELNSVRLFNRFYYNTNFIVDQIIPLVSQANMYFGFFLFVPIFLIVICAFKIYSLLKPNMGFLERYCVIYAFFSFSLINCLNFTIFFQQLWIKIAPVFLLVWFEKKILAKRSLQ